VTFHADYRLPNDMARPAESEIPAGKTNVPRLRVCLYEQHGRNDFRRGATARDDKQLACRDTDDEGNYEFRVSKSRCLAGTDCSHKYYLLTNFCAWGHGRPQICITANTKQGKNVRNKPLTKWAEYRKLMWSRSYRISLTDRTSNIVSWNLSCPAQHGLGRRDIDCVKGGRGGYFDRKNSNYGHSKDALHAFYSSAHALQKFGTFIPTGENTLMPNGTHCGGPRDDTDKNWQCHDAVRVVIRDMRQLGMEGDRHCARKWKARHPNWFFPQRSICLGKPFQPWALGHELGHVLHARWMAYRGGMNGGGPVSWVTGTAQKAQVGEGWADFVATATWFSRDALKPVASGWLMEDRAAAARGCQLGTSVGELNAAQFFWDLYDAANEAEPNDDVSLDFWTLLKVWSLFKGVRDGTEERDRAPGECNPHGRNIIDYLYHYERYPGKPLPEAKGLLRHNCLSLHEPRMKCE
jgi:hypothetical protein